MLSDEDRHEYIERYNRRLREFGYDPKSLGWGGGVERQNERFSVIRDFAQYSSKPITSVLDVGCGFGDLFGYLKDHCIEWEYTGIDINSELLEVSRRVFPGINVKLGDFSDADIKDDSFDLICASGIFNAKLSNQPDQYSYIFNQITKFLEKSAVGIAVDFMSTYVDWENPTAFHADPCVVLDFAKKNWQSCIIRADYLPYEFCLYVYK